MKFFHVIKYVIVHRIFQRREACFACAEQLCAEVNKRPKLSVPFHLDIIDNISGKLYLFTSDVTRSYIRPESLICVSDILI